MSNFQPKPNTGTLFKNSKKTNPKHPDMTGTYLTEDGRTRRMAAWTKEGKNGKFLSIVFSDEQSKPENSTASNTDSDSDLPW